jgi:nitroreductase
MMAPNSAGDRPWNFVVVRDKSKLQVFAGKYSWAEMFKNAAIAIVVCTLPKNGLMAGSEIIDCSAATENILLQAVKLGFGTCWNGLWVAPEGMEIQYNGKYMVKERINAVNELIGSALFPGEFPFCIIAVGEPGETPKARGWFESEKVRYV